MNRTPFRHLDFISVIEGSRVRLSKPDGHPVYRYDNIEYDVVDSVQVATELVRSQLDAKYVSSHFKKNHQHKRQHSHAGLCVVATMCCLYLLNDNRYVPWAAVDTDDIRHWWFTDIETSVVFDVTANQYTQVELESLYENGKPTPYYGWGQRPATRFLDLLTTVQPTTVRFKSDVPVA